MRRIAIHLCACLLITFILVGCKSGEKKADSNLTGPPEMYALTGNQPAAATEPQTPVYDTYDAYTPPPATEPSYASSYQPTSTAARYHTVAKKETLYSLARVYYNDHRRWKEIYEANKDAIGDPNKIYVGQRLVIP